MQVETIGEHASAQIKDTMNGARDARTDRLHAGGEVETARRLDDQVDVIALQRVVDHAEVGTVSDGAEGALEFAYEADGAERGDAAAEFQRDVAGVIGGEGLARSVRIARVRGRFATGAVATAAPGRGRAEVEGELAVASLHGMHRVTDA